MGGAVPFGAPPAPNFFNLPPGAGRGGPMYPSMDPSQAGTRSRREHEGPNADGSEAGPAPKRQQIDTNLGYVPGPAPPFGLPEGVAQPGFMPGLGGGGPVPPWVAGGPNFGGRGPPHPGWQPGGPPPMMPPGQPLVPAHPQGR